jgi:hypothetical protein
MPPQCGIPGQSIDISLVAPNDTDWNSFWYMRFRDQRCDIQKLDGQIWISWQDRSFLLREATDFHLHWTNSTFWVNELMLPYEPAEDIECLLGPGATEGIFLSGVGEWRDETLLELVTPRTLYNCQLEVVASTGLRIKDKWSITDTHSVYSTPLDWSFYSLKNDELVQPGWRDMEISLELVSPVAGSCETRFTCWNGIDPCVLDLAFTNCG